MGCVALRLALPLGVLAASGSELRLVRRYEYRPIIGDATAYLASARELLAGWQRLGVLLLPVAVVALLVLAGARRARGAYRVVLVGLAGAIVAAAGVLEMHRAGAGAIGWPLAWSVPLAPLRVLGVESDDAFFAAGLAASLLTQAVTVVAVGYAALRATASVRTAHIAAGLAAAWPLLLALALDRTADANNTWLVETGLALYSEPASTALVAAGTAFVLARTSVSAALGGVAFGLAVATRPTNALIALAALAVVSASRTTTLAYAVALGSIAPLVFAFEAIPNAYDVRGLGGAEFAAGNLVDSFADSSVHGIAFALAALVAIAGAARVGRRDAAFLLASVVLTAGFYAFFRFTSGHPRYFLAAVPALLVLAAAAFRPAVRAS